MLQGRARSTRSRRTRTITIYHQGDWFDLCRGPHMPSTGQVGNAFKLTKLAGAYWRGDQNRQQLQRIYGTAWRDREAELDAYLHMLEEAEKRDHRKIGREMDLFHLQEEAPGRCSGTRRAGRSSGRWKPTCAAGSTTAGYQEVKTPQLLDRKLWEASGHWEKFREIMFVARGRGGERRDRQVAALKPMNCPGHVQIFNQGIKSYRDLPLRMAEFGCLPPLRAVRRAARHHARARLHAGRRAYLLHARSRSRTRRVAFCALLASIYARPGFESFRIKFSDRPAKRAGSDEVWDQRRGRADGGDRAPPATRSSCNPGEGAFYGPKLEFVLTRRDRPRLAVRHVPGRLRAARPARRDLRRRGRRASTARSCCTGRSSARSSASSAS